MIDNGAGKTFVIPKIFYQNQQEDFMKKIPQRKILKRSYAIGGALGGRRLIGAERKRFFSTGIK